MKKKINRRSFIKKASIPVLGAATFSSFNVHASTTTESVSYTHLTLPTTPYV